MSIKYDVQFQKHQSNLYLIRHIIIKLYSGVPCPKRDLFCSVPNNNCRMERDLEGGCLVRILYPESRGVCGHMVCGACRVIEEIFTNGVDILIFVTTLSNS